MYKIEFIGYDKDEQFLSNFNNIRNVSESKADTFTKYLKMLRLLTETKFIGDSINQEVEFYIAVMDENGNRLMHTVTLGFSREVAATRPLREAKASAVAQGILTA